MSGEDTRLRGQRSRLQNSWALGSFPRKVILGLGKQFVHRMAIGHADITGDDFGTIFANAIEGTHSLRLYIKQLERKPSTRTLNLKINKLRRELEKLEKRRAENAKS